METTGRTVAEALEAALDQLGVDEHDAEVVILEEPKTALFGLRKSEARVRARVRPTRPRPKRQQHDRRGRSRDGGSRGASERTGAGRADTAGGDTGESAGSGRVPAAVGAEASGAGVTTADGSGGGASRSRRRRRRGGRSGGGGSGEVSAEGVSTDDAVDGDPGDESSARDAAGKSAGRGASRGRQRAGATRGGAAGRPREPEEEEMPIEQQAEQAERFVRGVVECFGLSSATTSVRFDDVLVEIAVEGEGLGLLIGPHGSTLSALQELTRTVVQRRGTEHGTRIVVDVAGYRAKRAAALAQFTKSVAAEVLATGRAHALEPMSASDRKIVHDTVNDIDGVMTSSEGEEERRHVVVHPASPAAEAAGEPEESQAAAAVEPADDAEEDELVPADEESDLG